MTVASFRVGETSVLLDPTQGPDGMAVLVLATLPGPSSRCTAMLTVENQRTLLNVLAESLGMDEPVGRAAERGLIELRATHVRTLLDADMIGTDLDPDERLLVKQMLRFILTGSVGE